jgi:TLD
MREILSDNVEQVFCHHDVFKIHRHRARTTNQTDTTISVESHDRIMNDNSSIKTSLLCNNRLENIQLFQNSLGDYGVALFCPLLNIEYHTIIMSPDVDDFRDDTSSVEQQKKLTISKMTCSTNDLSSTVSILEENGESDQLFSSQTQSSVPQHDFNRQDVVQSELLKTKPLSQCSLVTESETDSDEDSHVSDWLYPLSIRSEPILDVTECPRILTKSMMKELRDYGMPKTLQQYSWERCFSIGLHGDSFVTVLNQCRQYKYTVIVIRTTHGNILGGFASESWQPNQQQTNQQRRRHGTNNNTCSSYYGNGLSFLFAQNDTQSITSNENNDYSALSRHRQKRQLSIYKWTGKNDYCQICDVNKRILCMGGVGDFGIIIRNNLSSGCTGRSETYGNPPLVDKMGGCFDIADFEIYGLTSLHHHVQSSLMNMSSTEESSFTTSLPVTTTASFSSMNSDGWGYY